MRLMPAPTHAPARPPDAYRVLAGRSRQALLGALLRAERPMDATEAGRAVGLHRNTARVQLDVLRSAGLVRRFPEERASRGRPRMLYEAATTAADLLGAAERAASEAGDRAGYRDLARLLAAQLAERSDAARPRRRGARRRLGQARLRARARPERLADPAPPLPVRRRGKGEPGGGLRNPPGDAQGDRGAAGLSAADRGPGPVRRGGAQPVRGAAGGRGRGAAVSGPAAGAGPDGALVSAILRARRLLAPGRVSEDLRTVTHEGGREGDSFYRDRWSHDKVVRSTHGVNCTGSCSWQVYVKDGIITWETQQTDYPSAGPDSPEYEPRGCPRGASFSWYTYSPARIRYPYVRGVLLQAYRQ